MKGILLALCLAAGLSADVQGQDVVTLENVTTRSFTGVRNLNGQYYYTLYFGEKTETKGMANFVLSLFDKDLKPVRTTNIEVTKNSELAGSAFSGKFFLFVFADISKKTRTLVVLDASGAVVKQKVEEDVRRALLTAENFPDIHVLNENEFLLVRAEKDKKFGYEIERMDADLTSKWVKTYVPEKGIWSIEDSRLANNTLYLLRKEKPNALWGDRFNFAVQSINLENGEAGYTTELSKGDAKGFPSFIRVTPDGSVATGGMYFEDGKYSEKGSDGFFFALLNKDGSVKNFAASTWKEVRNQYKDDWINDFMGGKMRVLAEDVVIKKDGTFMVIAETFRKSNDPNSTGGGEVGTLRKLGALSGGFGAASSSDNTHPGDRGFTSMDFLFLNFDANGSFTGLQKVTKAPREAIVRGKLAEESALGMAQELYKRKYFAYRDVIEVGGKQYIMFKAEDGYKRKIYFLPVGQTSTQGIGSLDLDKWVSAGLNKMGSFSKLMGDNNSKTVIDNPLNAFESTNPELHSNTIPAKEGYVLLYNFSNSKMKIWLEAIPVE